MTSDAGGQPDQVKERGGAGAANGRRVNGNGHARPQMNRGAEAIALEGLRTPADTPGEPTHSAPAPESINGTLARDAAAGKLDARPRWWRDARRRRLLAGADLLAALVIGLGTAALVSEPLAWGLVALPLGLLSAKFLGLYDADHAAIRHLTIDELSSLAVWCGILIIGCALTMPGSIHAAAFVTVLPPAVVVAASLRGLARFTWRQTTPPESTLVVGAGAPARAIARKIELFDDMHLKLEGTEDPTAHLEGANGDEEAAMNRALAGIDRVVLAWEEASPRFIERLLGHCRRLEVKLSVISPFRGRARPGKRLSQVADLPVLEYNTWDVPRSTLAIKRAIDIAAAIMLLVLMAPLIALIALAIKLGDRGPVFYRQRRAGKGGKPFTIFKFRSMCHDAEARLPGLVDLDALPSPMYKLRSDPRVTRVGRLLRCLSVDELPQLINVVRGEMSLVGPRPEQIAVTERYLPEHGFRLAVKPGITGPMQIFGRGKLDFEERLAVEMDYVENVSVPRDLKFLLQTLPAVVRGSGAF